MLQRQESAIGNVPSQRESGVAYRKTTINNTYDFAIGKSQKNRRIFRNRAKSALRPTGRLLVLRVCDLLIRIPSLSPS